MSDYEKYISPGNRIKVEPDNIIQRGMMARQRMEEQRTGPFLTLGVDRDWKDAERFERHFGNVPGQATFGKDE